MLATVCPYMSTDQLPHQVGSSPSACLFTSSKGEVSVMVPAEEWDGAFKDSGTFHPTDQLLGSQHKGQQFHSMASYSRASLVNLAWQIKAPLSNSSIERTAAASDSCVSGLR